MKDKTIRKVNKRKEERKKIFKKMSKWRNIKKEWKKKEKKNIYVWMNEKKKWRYKWKTERKKTW